MISRIEQLEIELKGAIERGETDIADFLLGEINRLKVLEPAIVSEAEKIADDVKAGYHHVQESVENHLHVHVQE